MSRSLATRAKRLGGIASAAAIAFALAPALPVRAEPSASMFAAVDSPINVGIGTNTTAFVSLSVTGAVKASLTISTARLEVAVLTTDYEGCVTSGTTITCQLPDGTYSGLRIPLHLKAADGAKVGDTGGFDVQPHADNAASVSGSGATVTIADGPDLVADDPVAPDQTAKPGDVVWLPATLRNLGSQPARTPGFTFFLQHGLVPAPYDGCTYLESTFSTEVNCPVGEALDPGDGLTFVTESADGSRHPGLMATVAADADGRLGATFFADSRPAAMRSAAQAKKASGGRKYSAAAAAEPQHDLNGYNNAASRTWNVDNFVDVASIGATATGQAGDTVKVTIGVKNVGRASIEASHVYGEYYGEPSWAYFFTVPDGTSVVNVPGGCQAVWHPGDDEGLQPNTPARPLYACLVRGAYFTPGQAPTSEFDLRITKVIPNATGIVSFNDPASRQAPERTDDNAANDVAQVVINPTAAAGGGSGTGFLPVTGAQTAMVAGVGAALLAGGAVLFVMARRRRVVLVTPRDGEAE
ncbi:LPXTG cell wall anchor domain-containing protein [Dactylosporangium sp. CA-092794]|uniref:LPXTG cell wall anchor domain-containing protein n=1 Tax=Dactylosporangium sp. CA-092794 TaxID=3239929 RepID=UPI003D8DFD88